MSGNHEKRVYLSVGEVLNRRTGDHPKLNVEVPSGRRELASLSRTTLELPEGISELFGGSTPAANRQANDGSEISPDDWIPFFENLTSACAAILAFTFTVFQLRGPEHCRPMEPRPDRSRPAETAAQNDVAVMVEGK